MSSEVMIVTGEASGDLHGSRLVGAMRDLIPDSSFCGMGGKEMEAAGVELLYDAARISVVGFFEVISHLPDIRAAQKILRERLAQGSTRLLILIDLPDFNLLLARKAKELGIPVFYYISPQVWAWRSGRVKTIAKLVDMIGVILPFEQDYYRNRGVNAHYVGHPLLDSVASTMSRAEFCRSYQLDNGTVLLGVLPGSRIKEIKRLLPVFLEAALYFQEKSEQPVTILIPCATTLTREDLFEHGVSRYSSRLDIRIIADNRYDLMAACDAVVAASGTVTLELLLLNTPMVVAYKLSYWTYQLGRLLVKIEYFALVNLIAGRQIVPELLQKEADPARIAHNLLALVYDEKKRAAMLHAFAEQRRIIGQPGASQRAAALAVELMRQEHAGS